MSCQISTEIFDLGGTLRAYTPEQTLQKIKPLLLDVFGITRVADVTGLDTVGIPVSVCIRPNSKILTTSQGKGITPELAQISAIMESIEAWHAENIQAELHYGSYDELSKSHPMPHSERLLRNFISYPDVLSRQSPWLPVNDLLQSQPGFIPYALVSLDSTIHLPGDELFMGTSNGLAAGNILEEAICHGIYESIERDCTAEFNRQARLTKDLRRVRIASINSAHNRELIDRIQQAGLELYVFETTNRFGVSSFLAEIDDRHSLRGLGAFGGYGTHLSREVALSRAICEAVQSRLTLISGSRDDIMPHAYHHNIAGHADYPSEKYLEFANCHQDIIPDQFSDCVQILLNKLRQQGIQHVYLYDHTRPELNIAVVNVIIPELDFEWQSHRMATS
jgi:ribosomal protein S12 methylthiotransferase accessory factor